MENVALMVFDESARAKAALRDLRRLSDEGAFHLRHAAVVGRDGDGRFQVVESDTAGFADTAIGGVVGALLGAFVGPVGIIVGGVAGAAIGTMAGSEAAADSEAMVVTAFRSVPSGSTAIVADVEESDPEVVDAVIRKRRGRITRTSKQVLETELAEIAERTRREEI